MERVVFVASLMLFVLTTANSNAQTSFGVGAGFNWFTISSIDKDNFYSGDYIPRLGNQFVIVGEKALNNKWAAHLGFSYSMQYTQNYITRVETCMHYIKVQPMVKYSGFSPDWMQRLYVTCGIYYGYATTGFLREYADTGDFEEIKLSPGKDNCIKKASDLGFASEFGFQINKVRIGIFGQASFLNQSNVKNFKEHNFGLGVNMTYMFFNRKPTL